MTLVSEFLKKESDNKTKYSTFHLSSKAEITFNESNIHDVFKSIYSTIISSGKGLGWIINSVVDHTLNISKYKYLGLNSCIELPKELNQKKV